ncbi:MAG: site-specific integrase [Xanthobacteraceae bacterium]|nr:site-specific integrase [Xanthobacteraceae bacterium]MBX3533470.1 site-specific integrase [Xanthobacteraceae bacterium]MCW5676410.1 site-specific integrase [Xanthobacteraceae bacterium]
MAGKQAKTLSDVHVSALRDYCLKSRNPLRNQVVVLLSAKAGLRAGEIAKLTWEMLLTPTGQVGAAIELQNSIAKKGGGRLIPINPTLRKALEKLLKESSGTGPVILSERGHRMTDMSIVNWFAIAYRALGLSGCSSHSGRRTFITRAARMVHKAGGSLRDVQLLAGHRSIQTTQRYIDGDSEAQRKLVSLL